MVKNIWMLALANLRKNKGQAVSVTLVMLLATILLSIGLIVLVDVENAAHERAEYLNTSHFMAIESYHTSDNDRLEFIETFSGVSATETQVVLAGIGGYYRGDVLSTGPLIITDGTVHQEMNPLSFIGDYLPLVGDAIYLPHFIFLVGGFELGDAIEIDFMGTIFDFTVAGSTEDILFGIDFSHWRVHISAERFSELFSEFPDNQYRLLGARLSDASEAEQLLVDYNYYFFGTEYARTPLAGAAIPFPFLLDTVQENRIMLPSLIAVLLAAFSLIVLIVGIIVTRFRIVSSIEEGMVNMGALKAIGYRNRQIIASYVLQFGLLALVGSLTGMLLSYPILPLFAIIFEPLIGFIWIPTVNISLFFIIVGLLTLLVVMFSYLATRRIKKFPPLVALRGGLGTHNFKKNSIALDKRVGPVSFLLGLKQLLQNKKQVFSISLIVTGLVFASIIGLSMYYNMNVNPDALVTLMLGDDLPDIMIFLDPEEGENISRRLSEHPEVDRFYGSEWVNMFAGDVLIQTTVLEDFSYRPEESVAEGRLPLHDNEIVLGVPALRALDKEVGDWVTIRMGGIEVDFLVTGSIQSGDFGGFLGSLNVEGMRQVQPEFLFSQFSLHLVDDVDTHDFMESARETEGDVFLNVMFYEEEIERAMENLESVFALITMIILSATIMVIVVVLYMVIKMTIRRKRRDLGVQKALGFTTWQLMNQISMSLMPVIIFGIVAGSMLGHLGINPLFAVLMSGMGVTQVNFPTPIAWVLAMSIALALLAYVISMLIAWRIRKISAYALVTE